MLSGVEWHRPNTEQSKGDEPGKDTEADKPTGGNGVDSVRTPKGMHCHSNLEERVSQRPDSVRAGKAANGYVGQLAFQVRVVRRSV